MEPERITDHDIEPQADIVRLRPTSEAKPRRRTAEERRQRRQTLLGMLFSFCGLVVSLLVIEIAFRYLSVPPVRWNDRPQRYYYPAAAKNFADAPYAVPKKPGTFRVAVVGDSFSFAPFMQYDDTFAKRLERWLNLNNQKQRVEVINYGVPSYSTSHEVATTERALAEGADLILLQITLNDPEIKPLRPTGLILDPEAPQPKATGLLAGLTSSWKSLGFVVERLKANQSRQDYVTYYQDLYRKKSTYGSFEKALGKINSLATGAHVPLVAVVFPLFGHTVGPEYPFGPIHAQVAATLTELNIQSLDLLDAYRGIPVERLQVMPGIDRHPNEIGHRIAAEGILTWLSKTMLLPAESLPTLTSLRRIGLYPTSDIDRTTAAGVGPVTAPETVSKEP